MEAMGELMNPLLFHLEIDKFITQYKKNPRHSPINIKLPQQMIRDS